MTEAQLALAIAEVRAEGIAGIPSDQIRAPERACPYNRETAYCIEDDLALVDLGGLLKIDR